MIGLWNGNTSRAGDEGTSTSCSGSVSNGVEDGECGRDEDEWRVRASSETSGGSSSESLKSDWDHALWLGSVSFSRAPYKDIECVGNDLNGDDDGGG